MLAWTTTAAGPRVGAFCGLGYAVPALVGESGIVTFSPDAAPGAPGFQFANPFFRPIEGGKLIWLDDAGELPAAVTVYG